MKAFDPRIIMARPYSAQRLLERAAERLQEYCAEQCGDMNDPLAREIQQFLADPET